MCGNYSVVTRLKILLPVPHPQWLNCGLTVFVGCAMAMLESAAEMPVVDTRGLPNYRVTAIEIEVSGADVRILAGDDRFGRVTWSHICTIPAVSLLKVYPQFEKAMILAMKLVGATEGPIYPH